MFCILYVACRATKWARARGPSPCDLQGLRVSVVAVLAYGRMLSEALGTWSNELRCDTLPSQSCDLVGHMIFFRI
jgi:hypothetical protein